VNVIDPAVIAAIVKASADFRTAPIVAMLVLQISN